MDDKTEILKSAMKVAKDENDHHIIFGYIEEHMDPGGIPNISAVRYGIDRILLPEIIWERVPDLLDLLALAEEIRKRTVASADEALEWDEVYRKEGSENIVDGTNTGPEERAYLKKVRKPKNQSVRRETYRTVIMNICLLHIRHLRQSEDTYLIPFYFPQYFPDADELKKIKQENNPLWLSDMSDEELSIYERIRAKALLFLEQVEDWEATKYPNVSDEARLSEQYQKDFFQEFPPFFSWDHIINVLRHHVEKVQLDVEKLEQIFTDKQT